jgi:8-oxo-dGTP diphosphatase
MPQQERPKVILVNHINDKLYKRLCVGCLVLNREGKIVLQQRDNDSPSFPACLATFGGAIETSETPMQALIRELHEELGAKVNPTEVVSLGILSEPETNYTDLVYVFFWHDRLSTITGCYEGKANYYDNATEAETHPKIMNDVLWLLSECKKKKLLPG